MAVDLKKVNYAMSQLDKLYWTWAWAKAEEIIKKWWTVDDVKAAMAKYQATFKNSNKNWGTTTNIVSNNTSRTTSPATNDKWGNSYYRNVTGTPTSKPTGMEGKGDTSYVKDAWYWKEWNNWDKSADVSTDPNRSGEMQYHIDQDATVNPKLFKNRADYNEYYKYNESSDSQKQLLNEAWDNYNKYGFTSDENFVADQASKVADDKNNVKIQNAATKYSKLMPAINAIAKQFNDTLWPVINSLQQYQTQYLNNLAELRQLQTDYYTGMRREYDQLAAGQSASVGSTLSGQWLSQSAIASTINGIDKNWQSQYNNLMLEHVTALKNLQDSESNFMTTYWNVMWNLSTAQNQAMNTWFNAFKDLEDHMESTLNTAAEERYNPYQVIANSKVSWAAETVQSAGKTDSKQSEYQWTTDYTKKRSIIYNQLYWLLANDPTTFAKASKYISDAVAQNPNDWEAAVVAVLTKSWISPDVATSAVKNIIKETTNEDEYTDDDLIDDLYK